jgi:hypothetical protein
MKTELLSEMHTLKSHFCILVTASLRRGREEVGFTFGIKVSVGIDFEKMKKSFNHF